MKFIKLKRGHVMNEIIRLFPATLKNIINSTIADRWNTVQEIRIRLSQPIELVFDRHVEWIKHVSPSKKDCLFIINQLSEFSLYRMEDELREGFITIEGGHRVGLAGKVNTLKGTVKAIQYIRSEERRVGKECRDRRWPRK